LKIHPEKIALPASSQLYCEIGSENAVKMLLLLNPLDREWPHQRRYLTFAVTKKMGGRRWAGGGQ
jgi:hypothetical protein